jgi:hypothetical protein
MSNLIKKPKDFYSALFFIFIGVAVIYISRDYDYGTARRMGPGYFPVWLGSLLIFFSAIMFIRSFFGEHDPVDQLALKPVLLILGGSLLFGLLLRGAGLPIAIIVMVLLGASGAKATRPVPAVLLAVGLAIASYFIFVRGLGQPMPLLGSWFGSWSM